MAGEGHVVMSEADANLPNAAAEGTRAAPDSVSNIARCQGPE